MCFGEVRCVGARCSVAWTRTSHRKSRVALLVGILAVLVTAGCGDEKRPSARVPAGPSVAVIGDVPYGPEQVAGFQGDIGRINADPSVARVVHLGDIMIGPGRCDDRYFLGIRRDFDTFEDPLVYTPGDNEWTDCHRPNKGRRLPTERLTKLRSVFFDRPGTTLGKRPAKVEAQRTPFVENVLWEQFRTVFVTLNVPGSNNGREPWYEATAPSARQLKENRSRLRADLDWLDRAFDTAKTRSAAAVVVAMQADMWPGQGSGIQTSGFDPIVAKLAQRASAFGRPVLLLEGDSHHFKFDLPLVHGSPVHHVTTAAPNVQRIVVQGGQSTPREWLRLHVDPNKKEVFSWENVELGG